MTQGGAKLGRNETRTPLGVGRGCATASCLQEAVRGSQVQGREVELTLQAAVPDTTTQPRGPNVKFGSEGFGVPTGLEPTSQSPRITLGLLP